MGVCGLEKYKIFGYNQWKLYNLKHVCVCVWLSFGYKLVSPYFVMRDEQQEHCALCP